MTVTLLYICIIGLLYFLQNLYFLTNKIKCMFNYFSEISVHTVYIYLCYRKEVTDNEKEL